jgi:hypothetical protein
LVVPTDQSPTDPCFQERVLIHQFHYGYCGFVAVFVARVGIAMGEELPRELLLQLNQPGVEKGCPLADAEEPIVSHAVALPGRVGWAGMDGRARLCRADGVTGNKCRWGD